MPPMDEEEPSMSFIYIIGSGKGTLCKQLARDYNYYHLSVGDMLRRATNSNPPEIDQNVIDLVRDGKLLPIKELNAIMSKVFQDLKQEGVWKIMLDGFPRRLDQAKNFEGLFKEPALVLFFDCPEEVAKHRFVTRNIPGRDNDGGLFDRRYAEFMELNPEIVEFYESKKMLVKVDTRGETEISYKSVRDIMKTCCGRTMSASSVFRMATLEVERKFVNLTAKNLTLDGGSPHFQTLTAFRPQAFTDVYYDKSNMLSSNGVWLRERDGNWQAKIRLGGNFNNSKFEEVTDLLEISRHLRALLGAKISGGPDEHFGLDVLAALSTMRRSWLADGEFKIVLDTTDFGHTVGEVELERSVLFHTKAGLGVAQQKEAMMKEMDKMITKFMDHYSWAFCPGVPKGKLTAYFERNRKA
ncbi:hypothetical protein SLS56_011338 [Neofusicoccum ribis]|uniref:Adenylate kinase n=1 Tax=Neofusicoccum ribis TaxID=45134 RepID=A0ABR3SCK4_9PEZI